MELTLDETLQKAIEAHKAGQVQEADRHPAERYPYCYMASA